MSQPPFSYPASAVARGPYGGDNYDRIYADANARSMAQRELQQQQRHQQNRIYSAQQQRGLDPTRTSSSNDFTRHVAESPAQAFNRQSRESYNRIRNSQVTVPHRDYHGPVWEQDQYVDYGDPRHPASRPNTARMSNDRDRAYSANRTNPHASRDFPSTMGVDDSYADPRVHSGYDRLYSTSASNANGTTQTRLVQPQAQAQPQQGSYAQHQRTFNRTDSGYDAGGRTAAPEAWIATQARPQTHNQTQIQTQTQTHNQTQLTRRPEEMTGLAFRQEAAAKFSLTANPPQTQSHNQNQNQTQKARRARAHAAAVRRRHVYIDPLPAAGNVENTSFYKQQTERMMVAGNGR